MNSVTSNNSIFENYTINVKLKLAALWTAVMFCYVYGDYIQIYVPGMIAQAMEVTATAEKQIEFSLVAILMAVPSSMIFLSLVVKPSVNRWLNMGIATFFLVLNIVVNLSETWVFYLLLTAIESVINLAIIWTAWNWPKVSERSTANQ